MVKNKYSDYRQAKSECLFVSKHLITHNTPSTGNKLMKKSLKILVIIISIIQLNCCKSTSSFQKNDLIKYGYNGKVKSVKTDIYNLIKVKDTFKNGNRVILDKSSLLIFNEKGFLIEKKEFLSNGKVIKEERNTYDKKNRLIKKKEIDNYGTGSFYDYDYQYDSNDSLIRMIFSNHNFKRIHKIQRDKKNRPVKVIVYQNDTIYYTAYEVKYDKNNNIIYERENKENGKPFIMRKKVYDKNNLIKKELVTQYFTLDSIYFENIFEYDKKSRLILKKENVTNDSTYFENKYFYYKNGKIKKLTVMPKGMQYAKIKIIKFNKNGDVVESIKFSKKDKSKKIRTYKYKYDAKHNWIEKTEYNNNKPIIITKRTIEYYKN